jgi:NADH-quinone oxidoreductase subunit F
MQEFRVLMGHDTPGYASIGVYRDHGGYEALRKALHQMTPTEVTDEVYWSGLRGRGGAGFCTGMKWRFIDRSSPVPKYVVVNADEGEPGTFKDRFIMEHVPHRVIEGILIACHAVGAAKAYIYLRGELALCRERLLTAIEEARRAGLLGASVLGSDFDVDIALHRGAGAYICGEETALLDSLEGRRAQPRLKPPFPAQAGLYGCPTVVNNIETLANVPLIVEHGAEWYRSVGAPNPAVDAAARTGGPPSGFGPDSPGTRVFSVSGKLNNPGVFEVPMGTPMSALFGLAGGLREGLELRAVIPGGSSAPMIGPEHFEIPLTFQTLADAGSMLGSGAVVFIDDQTCPVDLALNLVEFYEHESCGKCTPCREGGQWMRKVIQRIAHGQCREGDLELVRHVSDGIKGKCFCALGESIPAPVNSSLALFPEHWQYHIEHGSCPIGAKEYSHVG